MIKMVRIYAQYLAKTCNLFPRATLQLLLLRPTVVGMPFEEMKAWQGSHDPAAADFGMTFRNKLEIVEHGAHACQKQADPPCPSVGCSSLIAHDFIIHCTRQHFSCKGIIWPHPK